ncbi:MAG TPA: PilN domain-containing protein [Vicinamibacterales bacterium]|nr:PilN domain-containing protein [Vicinamibacterales bacterium]
MLRTNLSTRPFYNDRAIHFGIGVAAVLIAAVTIWNIISVVSLSKQNTELSTRVNRDRAEAEQLTKMAGEIRGRMNKDELQLVVDEAREANALIDQRTFSWTAFFNHLEATMPPDVMLTSVRPKVDKGTTSITMGVLGRRAEDIDEFIEKLEATGAFEDVVPVQQDRTDEGLRRVSIQAIYTATAEPSAPDPAVEGATKPPAPAGPPKAPGASAKQGVRP